MIGNFNTDVALWESSKAAHRQKRVTFEIGAYGSVWKRGGRAERVAQFDDRAAAIACLTLAGYKRNGTLFT